MFEVTDSILESFKMTRQEFDEAYRSYLKISKIRNHVYIHDKIKCECGCYIGRPLLVKHRLSFKHKKLLESQSQN